VYGKVQQGDKMVSESESDRCGKGEERKMGDELNAV
jgi:hypothetical protein